MSLALSAWVGRHQTAITAAMHWLRAAITSLVLLLLALAVGGIALLFATNYFCGAAPEGIIFVFFEPDGGLRDAGQWWADGGWR